MVVEERTVRKRRFECPLWLRVVDLVVKSERGYDNGVRKVVECNKSGKRRL